MVLILILFVPVQKLIIEFPVSFVCGTPAINVRIANVDRICQGYLEPEPRRCGFWMWRDYLWACLVSRPFQVPSKNSKSADVFCLDFSGLKEFKTVNSTSVRFNCQEKSLYALCRWSNIPFNGSSRRLRNSSIFWSGKRVKFSSTDTQWCNSRFKLDAEEITPVSQRQWRTEKQPTDFDVGSLSKLLIALWVLSWQGRRPHTTPDASHFEVL